jgi:hypothetical protein
MLLSELFKTVPHKSALVVPCEASPGHSDQKYVRLSFSKTVLTTIREGKREVQVPVDASVSVNICPSCFNKWVYDLTKVAQELHTA